MTDFVPHGVTPHLFSKTEPRREDVGLGPSLVAVLIVAAITLVAIKLSGDLPSTEEQPLLIPSNAAAWSDFTA